MGLVRARVVKGAEEENGEPRGAETNEAVALRVPLRARVLVMASIKGNAKHVSTLFKLRVRDY